MHAEPHHHTALDDPGSEPSFEEVQEAIDTTYNEIANFAVERLLKLQADYNGLAVLNYQLPSIPTCFGEPGYPRQRAPRTPEEIKRSYRTIIVQCFDELLLNQAEE